MVTTAQAATGVGTGAIGLFAGEAILALRDQGRLDPGTAQIMAVGSGVGAMTMAVTSATELPTFFGGGFGPLTEAGLFGYGVGSLGWVLLRNTGIAPKLTFDPPEEIDLAVPIGTTLAFGAVSLAINQFTKTVR